MKWDGVGLLMIMTVLLVMEELVVVVLLMMAHEVVFGDTVGDDGLPTSCHEDDVGSGS